MQFDARTQFAVSHIQFNVQFHSIQNVRVTVLKLTLQSTLLCCSFTVVESHVAGLYSRPHTPTVSGVGEGGREGKVAAATSTAGMARRLAVQGPLAW